jgi:hypothetical protein
VGKELMAKREKQFTTQIIASLRAAGVRAPYKIPDPQFGGGRMRYAEKRPCDVIGTLPGGRALHMEVKQREMSDATGLPFAFAPSALAGHQREHLSAVSCNGGAAIVALVSWQVRSAWNLYLWEWSDFVQATYYLKQSISQDQLRATPSLPRLKPGKLGWDLSEHVRRWTGDLVYLSAPYGGSRTNLAFALDELCWAQTQTQWGLRVQAPWIPSAHAGYRRADREEDWLHRGGVEVEERVLRGYRAVYHCGIYDDEPPSPGMQREALFMVNRLNGRVYRRYSHGIQETTDSYRGH